MASMHDELARKLPKHRATVAVDRCHVEGSSPCTVCGLVYAPKHCADQRGGNES